MWNPEERIASRDQSGAVTGESDICAAEKSKAAVWRYAAEIGDCADADGQERIDPVR